MRGFEVVPDALTDAANAIRDLGERLADSPTTGYTINPAQVGHDLLADAIANLHDASQRGLELLATTVESAAARLNETAELYRKLDQRSAEHLSALRP